MGGGAKLGGRRVVRPWAAMVVSAVLMASCGGNEEEGTTIEGSDQETVAPSEVDDSGGESDSAPAAVEGGTDLPSCETIFSLAEIEELFAEPATLTESTDDSLGQLICDWETIEDPDSDDDFAFKLLQAQVYSGDPVPAAAFVDPSIFESVVTIPDIGDVAYTVEPDDTWFFFVDEPVGGSLSYVETDFGSPGEPELRSRADIEELFRTFHERVT